MSFKEWMEENEPDCSTVNYEFAKKVWNGAKNNDDDLSGGASVIFSNTEYLGNTEVSIPRNQFIIGEPKMKAIFKSENKVLELAMSCGTTTYGYQYKAEFKNDDKLFTTIDGNTKGIMYLIGVVHTLGDCGLVEVRL